MKTIRKSMLMLGSAMAMSGLIAAAAPALAQSANPCAPKPPAANPCAPKGANPCAPKAATNPTAGTAAAPKAANPCAPKK